MHKSLADLEKLHSSGQGENLFLPTLVGHDYHNKVLLSVSSILRILYYIKFFAFSLKASKYHADTEESAIC